MSKMMALFFALQVILSACGDEHDTQLAIDTPSLSSSLNTPDIRIDRSLAITDTVTLTHRDLSMRRVVQAIIDSSGGATASPEDFLGSLLDSFRNPSVVNPESQRAVPVDVRAGEANLDPASLLTPGGVNEMKIVAIFNRFDRTPSNGAHCGQARILYAKPRNEDGRLFLFFEGSVPNPRPAMGRHGCRAVASFWAFLSALDNPRLRAKALEQFLFNGVGITKPVVRFANYAAPIGAVNVNLFVNNVKWQLRSFGTALDSNNKAMLFPRPLVRTPLTEFYDATFEPAPDHASRFAMERSAFRRDFLERQVPLLAAAELSGNPNLTANDILGGFGVAFDPRYLEFQSDSQGEEDVPVNQADVTFKAAIARRLARLDAPGVTTEQLLNRAGVRTCGGCHQFSNGVSVGTDGAGNDVRWPSSAGFVHTTEDGTLSPLLVLRSLPARREGLVTYLREPQR